KSLKKLPNVHLTGAKPHEELPKYIGQFDVGIVPYLHSDYTRTVVPTKIIEYLAMGKPVVSTDLPEVSAFNEKHGVIITSPNEPGVFLSSIEAALESPHPEHQEKRREVATLSGWENRFAAMCNVIENALALKDKNNDE